MCAFRFPECLITSSNENDSERPREDGLGTRHMVRKTDLQGQGCQIYSEKWLEKSEHLSSVGMSYSSGDIFFLTHPPYSP
jgi:hypothetical protein